MTQFPFWPRMTALLALGGLAVLPFAARAQTPDVILLNAQIITMNPDQPSAQAIALAGDRIVALGTDPQIAALASQTTRRVDLAGRTVIPGLIDAHTHAIRGGQTYAMETYLYDITTLPDAFARMREAASARDPSDWVAVVGSWHPNQFAEKRAPTVQELSEAVPDHPVYMQYLYDYALLNQKGIETLGLDQPGAEIGHGITVERDAEGRATGKLLGGIGPFNALFEQLADLSDQQRKDSLQAFFAELNASGMTGVIDPSAGPPDVYLPLFDLRQQDALSLRVGYRIPAMGADDPSDWFHRVMAFRPPHTDDGMLAFLGLGENLVFKMNDGVTMGPGFAPDQAAEDELVEVADFAARRHIPVEIHAYTDDAASAILDAFEAVAATTPLTDLRWSLAHLNTGSVETLDRMRALGLAYSVQMGPYFEAPAILAANDQTVSALSPPIRLALDRGLIVAGGTDSTRIGAFGVWQAIEYGLTGKSMGDAVEKRADQLLTRDEALSLYTRNAAWIAFAEQDRGMLAPGMLADLAVLDRPYMTMPVDEVHNIRSVLTLLGGKPVHDPEGMLAPQPGEPR